MSKKKKYENFSDEIINFIKEKGLQKGDKLPSVRELIVNSDYSYTTVNRTLNEMERAGYISKAQGKGIYVNDINGKSSSLKQVIFIIPQEISDSKIFLEVLSGLKKVFDQHDIKLMISISNRGDESIESVIDNNMCGLVIFLEDNYINDYLHLHELKKKKVPFVLVDRFVEDIDTDYVVINNKDTFIRIISYLKYKESCDYIYFITHKDFATSHNEKIDGFEMAIKMLYSADAGEIISRQEFIEQYDKISSQDKKFGLCFYDDLEIAILIKRLNDQNKRLASNFTIFGYNNCYEVHNFPTVEQFNDKVGEKAAELLLRRMENPDTETSHIRIEPKLIFPNGQGGVYYDK